MEILIITDDDGNFHCHHKKKSMDIKRMVDGFSKNKIRVELMKFKDIISSNKLYEIKNKIIVYTSIEKATQYKKMIMDVMYILSKDNTLVPNYDILMSHENKSFQEYYKKYLNFNSIGAIEFCSFKNFLEFRGTINYPIIYKCNEGSGSAGVKMAHNKNDIFKYSLNQIINNVNNNLTCNSKLSYKFKVKFMNFLVKILPKKISFKLFQKFYKTIYTTDCSFLLQDYIEGHNCDYKVLVYFDKIFCLKRNVRKNDFRASGSGKFESTKIPDFALKDVMEFYKILNIPIGSFDIFVDEKENKTYFIEWQGIHHGPATVLLTKLYCECSNGKFLWKENNNDIEDIFVYAYSKFILGSING